MAPGTPVDIFIAADQPAGRWVWVTGYVISTSKKDRHKRLGMTWSQNPLTKEIERCYGVQKGARVFPVCQSHVRLSSPSSKDTWEYPVLGERLKAVKFLGVVVSDESDKADLEALDSSEMSERELF